MSITRGLIEGSEPPVMDELKKTAISTLSEVLSSAESEDVRRKAAVDILNFSEKARRDTVVTEEQLGWLGRVIIEAEKICDSL